MLWNKKEEKSLLPDLPSLETPFKQELSQISQAEDSNDESDSIETHALPSFPDSANLKGFSQTVIKGAVSDEDKDKGIESVGDTPKTYKIMEMEEAPTPNQVSIIGDSQTNSENPTVYQTNSEPMAKSIIPNPPAQKRPAEKPAQFQHSPAPTPLPPAIKESFTPLPSRFAKMPLPEKHSHIFVKIDKFFSAKKALEETKMQLNQIEDILRKIREVKLKEEQELATWEKELLTAKSRIAEVTQNIFEKVE